jgi:hypothetical protein
MIVVVPACVQHVSAIQSYDEFVDGEVEPHRNITSTGDLTLKSKYAIERTIEYAEIEETLNSAGTEVLPFENVQQ